MHQPHSNLQTQIGRSTVEQARNGLALHDMKFLGPNGASAGLDALHNGLENGIVRVPKSDNSSKAQGSTWAFVYLAPSILLAVICFPRPRRAVFDRCDHAYRPAIINFRLDPSIVDAFSRPSGELKRIIVHLKNTL